MGTELKPIAGIEFLADKHYYRVRGKFIPSVSSILKPISKQVYGDVDKEILQKAAERGTDVHFAIEVFDDTGAEIIAEEHRGYFEAYKKFRAEHSVWEVVATEYRAYEPTLWYAGTADKIFRNKATGNLVLVDFKTSYAIELSVVIPQLTGYKLALEAHGICISEICVIQLRSDGEYVKEEIVPDIDIFLSCLTIQNHIKKHKKGA